MDRVNFLLFLGPDDSEPGTADTSLNEGDTSLASQSGSKFLENIRTATCVVNFDISRV